MILHEYKIVFGGTMGSGKSSAIQALSDIEVLKTEAFNTDVESHTKLETTVGIDYGEITLDDGLKIGLYGTPGQDRFKFMWPVICQGAIGTVVLIDHSSEHPLKDLDFYVKSFQSYTNDIVIGITHLDEKVDRTTAMYREWLNEHQYPYPLYFLDARLQDDVHLVVESLIASIEVNLDKI